MLVEVASEQGMLLRPRVFQIMIGMLPVHSHGRCCVSFAVIAHGRT